MNIEISEKTYDYLYTEINGKSLRKIDMYNKSLASEAESENDLLFIVYTSDKDIQLDKEYTIWGIGSKKYFWGLVKHVNFLYLVDLYDDKVYFQNSGAGCVRGYVKPIQKYKFNFDIGDVDKKGNTFLNLVQKIGYDIENVCLETYALSCFNIRLLENIFKYKNKSYDDYCEHLEGFKKYIIRQIKITNSYKEVLLQGIREVNTFKELAKYVKENREKFLDQSDLLYDRNDNIKNCYPVNMINTNVSLDLYNGYNFNSALPFYFQFRNYRQSTELLANIFFDEIFTNEDRKRTNEIKKMKYYYGNQPLEELEAVDTSNYGLYFPLLMTFRQSIELAFKLIFVNEDLKKQDLKDKKELNEYAKRINTHDLIPLLKEIKVYLNEEVYEFLFKLASFVYYNEGTDASFSRYLIDKDLDFDELKKITIYYIDLYNYINEFYQIIDQVFASIDFGFDIDDVFTK